MAEFIYAYSSMLHSLWRSSTYSTALKALLLTNRGIRMVSGVAFETTSCGIGLVPIIHLPIHQPDHDGGQAGFCCGR